MIEVPLIAILIGLGVGLVLGAFGGGGSILTVPALVYLMGQSPQVAIATSLLVVGINSTIGALLHGNQGYINLRVALLFGVIGMVSAYSVARVSTGLSDQTLMVMFALLVFVVGLVLLFGMPQRTKRTPSNNLLAIMVSGAVVGSLTGLLGVGGGFLIAPALVLLIGLSIHEAIGTSLIIIAMNSFAGFSGHIEHISGNLGIILPFLIAGLIGTIVGSYLSNQLKEQSLQRAYAFFVLVLGCLLLVMNF